MPIRRSKQEWRCRPLVLLAACSIAGASVNAAPAAHPDSVSYEKRASLAVAALQSWYVESTGLYRTTGWWNAANAITVLVDFARITESKQYDSVFPNTLSAAQKTFPGFLNQYYDDEGWWALAWMDVYDLTRDQRYLSIAKSIFEDMTGAWGDTCSGGIWWDKKHSYKNAIANELFLSVAAHLATRVTAPEERASYLSWANREWQWFSHSGMINAGHLVNDGLDAQCANNHRTTWSYNQGVIVGGLAELNRASHDAALLSTAGLIAGAALSSLTDAQGILHDSCEPKCGADGTQFKGIFVRNLRSLNDGTPVPQFEEFVYKNADSIWSGAHPPDYHLGQIWSAPFGTADASSQSSALDVLVSAADISKKRKPQ